jgi:hypothetical protein
MRTALQLGLLAVAVLAVTACSVAGTWSIDLDLDPSPLLQLQQGPVADASTPLEE